MGRDFDLTEACSFENAAHAVGVGERERAGRVRIVSGLRRQMCGRGPRAFLFLFESEVIPKSVGIDSSCGLGGGQHRMARPYSQDLRDRVVASVASGRTCRATAALFGVSVASVVKWSQRWRATGSAAAKPMGGGRQLRLEGEREWLLARIAEKPDLTLRAVVAELAERGTPASHCDRCGASASARGSASKKTLHASEQDRADIARRRARWKKHQGRLDPKRLVFIDETWAKTNMTRRHGCAPARRAGWSPRCRTATGGR